MNDGMAFNRSELGPDKRMIPPARLCDTFNYCPDLFRW